MSHDVALSRKLQARFVVPNPPRNLHLLDSELSSLTFEFDPPVGGFDSFVGQCRAIDDASETIRATVNLLVVKNEIGNIEISSSINRPPST